MSETETVAPVTAAPPASVPAVESNLLADAQVGSLLGDTTSETATEPGKTAADGDKPAAEKPGDAPAYEDFKLPEGVTLDKAGLDAFTSIAKEVGVPQEKAQALLDLYTAKMTDALAGAKAAGDAATQARNAGWQAQVKADPEVGGANLTANLSIAAKVIDQFGGAALRKALNETGAGNNPDIVRAFIRVGKMLSEPTFTRGQPVTAAKGLAESLYPSLSKQGDS